MLLLVTTVISAGAGLALMATSVGRQALVDQWERTAVAFGQDVDDEAYARLEALSDRSAAGYALLSALIGGPVLTVAVAALAEGGVPGRGHIPSGDGGGDPRGNHPRDPAGDRGTGQLRAREHVERHLTGVLVFDARRSVSGGAISGSAGLCS